MFTQPFRLISKPQAQLEQQARPLTGIPEVVPGYFFHRRTYTSGTTTELDFFNQTEADRGLSNMELAGQIPTPQYLEVYSFHVDVLQPVSTAAGGVGGGINNNELLRRSGRGRWIFELSGKTYGEFPLTGIGPTGNPVGFGWGTFTAEESIQWAGWIATFGSTDPLITIPPTTGFRARLRWTVAQTLDADQFVEFGLWGALHRKIV